MHGRRAGGVLRPRGAAPSVRRARVAVSEQRGPRLEYGFTGGEASRITGVKYSTLDYWDRSGFIRPSISIARGLSGRGRDRIYSFRDLVALRTARELRGQGVPLQRIRKIVRFLSESAELDQPLAQARLVVVGDDVMVVRGQDGSLESALDRPGQGVLQFVLVLELNRLVNEVLRLAEAEERSREAGGSRA